MACKGLGALSQAGCSSTWLAAAASFMAYTIAESLKSEKAVADVESHRRLYAKTGCQGEFVNSMVSHNRVSHESPQALTPTPAAT
jgi:hypothetical protein